MAYDADPKQRRGGADLGCLVVLLVVLSLFSAAGVFMWVNWQGWAATGLRQGTAMAVRSAGFPRDQETRMLARIEAVAADFDSGLMRLEDLRRVLGEVTSSHVLPLAAVQFADARIVAPSALSPDEKEAGRRSVQRFIRGVCERKLHTPDVEAVLTPIRDVRRNSRLFKPNPSADDVRAFLSRARAFADQADIPDEPFTVNFADELDRVIDRALSGIP